LIRLTNQTFKIDREGWLNRQWESKRNRIGVCYWFRDWV